MNKKLENICFSMLGHFLAIIVTLIIIFVFMCFSGHKEFLNSCIVKLSPLTNNSIPTHQVSQDAFLSTITNFYTTILSFLIAIICMLSILGFLYVKHASKREIRKEVEESLGEYSFQLLLSEKINEHQDITEVVEKYGRLAGQIDCFNCRIEFLEKLVDTKDSDTLK